MIQSGFVLIDGQFSSQGPKLGIRIFPPFRSSGHSIENLTENSQWACTHLWNNSPCL